ncbi:MAG: hypothetical protein ACRD9Q_06205, partial [Nitrososphaeraceae archaeon]
MQSIQRKNCLGYHGSRNFGSNPDVALEKIVRKNRLVISKNTIQLTKYERIFVIGLGKAADLM